MTRTVVKRLHAILGTEGIADHIAKDNVDAALRFVDAVEESCEFLGQFPQSGDRIPTRKKHLKGLRAWQVKGFRNYIILYCATDSLVEILAVIHGARNLRSVIRQL
jgi:toxin ParE1/3/4